MCIVKCWPWIFARRTAGSGSPPIQSNRGRTSVFSVKGKASWGFFSLHQSSRSAYPRHCLLKSTDEPFFNDELVLNALLAGLDDFGDSFLENYISLILMKKMDPLDNTSKVFGVWYSVLYNDLARSCLAKKTLWYCRFQEIFFFFNFKCTLK